MLKTLNGIRLIRFEPEIHSQVLYHWYYSGDYPEFFRNYPTCPSLQEIAGSASGKALMVSRETDGAILGCVMHFNEKEFSRNFEVGVLIDRQLQGCQIGITALKILLDWKFNNCNLYKAKVNCIADNNKLISIVEKFGFALEGTLKKESFFNGDFHNVAVYAMFKTKFNNSYKSDFETQEARLEACQQEEAFSNVRFRSAAS